MNFELQFIKSLLNHPQDVDEISKTFTEEDLSSERSKVFFSVAKELISQKKEGKENLALFYKMCVQNKMPPTEAEILELFSDEEVSSPEELKDIVKQNTAKERTIGTLKEALKQINPESNLEDNLDFLEKEVKDIREGLERNIRLETFPDKILAFDEAIAHANTDDRIASLYPTLDHWTGGWGKGQLITVAARTSIGKALDIETPILTMSGFVPMKDIHVGHIVFDEKGRPTTVISKSERMCHEAFAITFKKDEFQEVLKADEGHVWKVRTENGEDILKTTKELIPLKDRIIAPRSFDLSLFSEDTDFSEKESFEEKDPEDLSQEKVKEERSFLSWLSQGLFWKTAKEKKGEELSNEEEAEKKKEEISIDILSLDSIGMHEVECISVASSTSMYLAGRMLIPTHNSFFATNSALAAGLQKRSVLFFSLEMTDTEVISRLVAALGKIPLAHIFPKKNLSYGEKGLYKDTLNQLSQMNINIVSDPGLTIGQIKDYARRQMKTPEGLHMIIVDYIGLLNLPSGRSRQEEMAEASRSMKVLAKELNIPIMILSQIRRSVDDPKEERSPSLSEIRESGAIAQDSDIVILLHRNKSEKEESRPKALFILAKNRQGPSDKFLTVGNMLDKALFKDPINDKEENAPEAPESLEDQEKNLEIPKPPEEEVTTQEEPENISELLVDEIFENL